MITTDYRITTYFRLPTGAMIGTPSSLGRSGCGWSHLMTVLKWQHQFHNANKSTKIAPPDKNRQKTTQRMSAATATSQECTKNNRRRTWRMLAKHILKFMLLSWKRKWRRNHQKQWIKLLKRLHSNMAVPLPQTLSTLYQGGLCWWIIFKAIGNYMIKGIAYNYLKDVFLHLLRSSTMPMRA